MTCRRRDVELRYFGVFQDIRGFSKPQIVGHLQPRAVWSIRDAVPSQSPMVDPQLIADAAFSQDELRSTKAKILGYFEGFGSVLAKSTPCFWRWPS